MLLVWSNCVRTKGCLHAEILGAAIDNIFPVFRFLFLQFQVFFDDVVRISCLVGYVLIELGYGFVSQLFYQAHHHCFIVFQFAVLEFTFYGFFGELCLAGLPPVAK